MLFVSSWSIFIVSGRRHGRHERHFDLFLMAKGRRGKWVFALIVYLLLHLAINGLLRLLAHSKKAI
jgi:hypothetical protein